MAPFAPEVLVLEEGSEVIEGDAPFPRTVIIKFASREAAIARYNSAEYQAVCCLLVDRFVWPAS
jgi:uncharacterized protein (DUF1330 family)